MANTFQKDWIMRQIEMMVQFIARMIFKKDAVHYQMHENATDEERAADELHQELRSLIEADKLGDAEDLLFSRAEPENRLYMELAIDFYSRLNNLNDEALERGGFMRDEIMQGLDEMVARFGISIPLEAYRL